MTEEQKKDFTAKSVELKEKIDTFALVVKDWGTYIKTFDKKELEDYIEGDKFLLKLSDEVKEKIDEMDLC